MYCEDYETQTNCTYLSKAMTGSTASDLVLAFWHLFMWFWSSGFVNAIGTMTVAGTIGKWYFKKTTDRVGIIIHSLLKAHS